MHIFNYFNPTVHFTYLGIFILLSLVGYIIPLPEEILLLTVGYLTAINGFKIIFIIPVAILGLLAGDLILYFFSYKGSFFTKKLFNKINDANRDKFFNLYKRKSGYTIFLTRFIIGIRFLGPFLAGSQRLPVFKFVLFDLLALIFYAPAFILLGYYYHNKFAVLISEITLIRHLLLVVFIIFIIVIFNFYIKKKIFKKT